MTFSIGDRVTLRGHKNIGTVKETSTPWVFVDWTLTERQMDDHLTHVPELTWSSAGDWHKVARDEEGDMIGSLLYKDFNGRMVWFWQCKIIGLSIGVLLEITEKIKELNDATNE